jgi:hypothetical protein
VTGIRASSASLCLRFGVFSLVAGGVIALVMGTCSIGGL